MAGKTTGTTRIKLKELERLNHQLQQENRQLYEDKKADSSVTSAATTKTTKAKLSEAAQKLATLKATMAEQDTIIKELVQSQQSNKTHEGYQTPHPAGAILNSTGQGN